MSPSRPNPTIPLSLPVEIIERADALMAKADRFPELRIARKSRSAVFRLAILRGLDVLEAEVKAGRK